jgi:hypothetical protein
LSLLLNTGISSILRAFPVARVLLSWQPTSQAGCANKKSQQTHAATLNGQEMKIMCSV